MKNLHHENRIKAQEVSAEEYAYYANYGETNEEPEPGWHSGEAMGLVRGYDSDTVSESLGFETACLAHKGKKYFRVLNFLQKIHNVDFHHLCTVFTHSFHILYYKHPLL